MTKCLVCPKQIAFLAGDDCIFVELTDCLFRSWVVNILDHVREYLGLPQRRLWFTRLIHGRSLTLASFLEDDGVRFDDLQALSASEMPNGSSRLLNRPRARAPNITVDEVVVDFINVVVLERLNYVQRH